MVLDNLTSSIAAYKMVYLKGTYNRTTGLFTLKQASDFFVVAPSNTANITLSSYFESGYDYILIGGTYSSANYLNLREQNTMYHFDGTNLIPYDTYNDNRIEGLIPTNTNQLTNGAGFITGITGSMVISALGYTPYNSSNPNGYTSNIGTVTQVKVGNTEYNPSSGVVSLPAYPTTLPASDVYAWAKASTKPSYTASEIIGYLGLGGTRTAASMTWGTLKESSGYTVRLATDQTGGGGLVVAEKDGKTYLQVDGEIFVNEGASQLAKVSQIPSVGNGTLTIKAAGNSKGTFTANQSGNTEINITAADLGLASALRYIGEATTSSPAYNGTYIRTVIGGTTYYVKVSETTSGGSVEIDAAKGDVITIGNKEYVCETPGKYNSSPTNSFRELGNEGSYALSSVSITGTGALGGGGSLTTNRTITHQELNTSGAQSTAKVFKVTLDKYGHVLSATAATAADVGARSSSWMPTAAQVGALPTGTTLDSIADGSTRKLADYMPLSGGTFSGTIKFNSSSLPSKSLQYVVGIDAFASGGEMGWQSKSDFLSGYATQTWVGQQGYLIASDISGKANDSEVVHKGTSSSNQPETIYGLKTFNSPIQAISGITLGNANSIKPITMNSSTSNGRFIRLYPTENNTGVFDIYFPAANGTLATQEWVTDKGYLVASDISGKANNSEVVHNTGAEQIDGGKTFNSFTQHKSGLIVGTSNTIKPITMHSSTANGRAIRLYPTENNSSNFDIYLPAANGTLATINYVDNSTKLYKHTVELAKYGANNYIVVVFYTKSSTDFNINALLEAYGGTNNELAIPFSGNNNSNPAIGNFSQIITSQDSQTGYAVIGEWLVSGNGGNFSDFSFDIDFIFDYVEEVQ